MIFIEHKTGACHQSVPLVPGYQRDRHGQDKEALNALVLAGEEGIIAAGKPQATAAQIELEIYMYKQFM